MHSTWGNSDMEPAEIRTVEPGTPIDPASLLDLAAIGMRLASVTAEPAWRECTATLVTGGKSNLTFELRSSAGAVILRRPPIGKLLPRAHDMGREVRIQAALRATPVPVAQILFYDDGPLIGVPCYVMVKVPGRVVRDALPPYWAESTADRRRLSFALVDTLVALHSVDYQAVGLGDYGRPDGFVERQIRRWTGQWERSRTRDVPAVAELARRLATRVPPSGAARLVHGDYRLDNCVLDEGDPGTIRAVLDWELSTVGDPLADVGGLLYFWREPGERHGALTPGVSHLPGFPTRAELADRYARQTGRDLSDIGYYQALAHFRYAVITQGVATRAAVGAMGGQHFGNLDDEVHKIAADGLAAIG